MKLHATCCLFLALALTSGAETALPPPSQELFPMESSITHHSPAYYAKLRTVLFENTDTGDPFASRMLSEDDFQFLVLPPFTPETLLTVSKRGTIYVAVVRSPEKQIWSFEGDIAALGVDRREKLLPAPIAQRADRLWREMLIRARFADTGVYPDGVSYCFFKFTKGLGNLAGKTYPRNGTRPLKLVGVGLNLVRYVRADAEGEDAILKSLDTLMGQLEKELSVGSRTEPVGFLETTPELYDWQTYVDDGQSTVEEMARALHGIDVLTERMEEILASNRKLLAVRSNDQLALFNQAHTKWEELARLETSFVANGWSGGSGYKAALPVAKLRLLQARVLRLLELKGAALDLNE